MIVSGGEVADYTRSRNVLGFRSNGRDCPFFAWSTRFLVRLRVAGASSALAAGRTLRQLIDTRTVITKPTPPAANPLAEVGAR